jgi:hypothetical protein
MSADGWDELLGSAEVDDAGLPAGVTEVYVDTDTC